MQQKYPGRTISHLFFVPRVAELVVECFSVEPDSIAKDIIKGTVFKLHMSASKINGIRKILKE
jgi:hypothetical protein